MRGVGLELDPLLEVDQVELDLAGTVVQRRARHQRMQEGAFPRAGFASHQQMLRSTLTESHLVQTIRAGTPDGDTQLVTARLLPECVGLGSNDAERDFD